MVLIELLFQIKFDARQQVVGVGVGVGGSH